MLSRKRSPLFLIVLTAFLLLWLCPSLVYAHKGNPWHNKQSAKLGLGFGTEGLGSAFLSPKEPGASTKFTLRYDVDVPKLITDAEQRVIGIIPDKAFDDGIVTAEELTAFKISEESEEYSPLELSFSISEAGVYHFFFGPWDGTVLFLGEDPPVELSSEDGKFEWLARVGGDVALVYNPKTEGQSNGAPPMIIWVIEIFDEVREQYSQKTVLSKSFPPSASIRDQIYQKVKEFQSNQQSEPATVEFPFQWAILIIVALILGVVLGKSKEFSKLFRKR